MTAAIFCWLCLVADAPAVAPPRFDRGLEIGWKGRFTEEMTRPGVSTSRSYDFECRLFILETHEKGADAALLTVVKLRGAADTKPNTARPTSARIDLVRIDPQGWMYDQPSVSLSEPLEARLKRKLLPLNPAAPDGLPLPETAILPPVPDGWNGTRGWEVPVPGRGLQSWKPDGIESERGTRCHRLLASLSAGDWNNPDAEKGAWRRTETIHLSATHGYALKAERLFERKDPGTDDVSVRTRLTYEHAGQLRYTGRSYDERREEISMAATLGEEFEKFVADGARTQPASYARLAARAEHYATVQRPFGETLPYREALNSTRRKAEAAMKGHLPLAMPQAKDEDAGPVRVDKTMPGFEIENLNSSRGEMWKLAEAKGSAVLLAYYQPHADSAEEVLKAVQKLKNDRTRIVAFAVGDEGTARQQAKDWKINIPIVRGSAIRKAHGVEATPTFIVVDAQGVVRKIAVGWGEETVEMLRMELAKAAK